MKYLKPFALFSAAFMSTVSLAGALPPPDKKLITSSEITLDGHSSDWDQIEEVQSITDSDLGLVIKITEFKRTYNLQKFQSNGGMGNSSTTTGPFEESRLAVLIRSEVGNQYFNFDDEMLFKIRWIKNNTKYTQFVQTTECVQYQKEKFLSALHRTCIKQGSKDAASHTPLIRNNQTGEIELQYPRDGYAESAYYTDGVYEYVEFYIKPYETIEIINAPADSIYPFYELTAKNGKATSTSVSTMATSLNNFKLNASAFCSLCNTQPGKEAYLPDLPDIRPIVQIGVSAQVPNMDVNIVGTTDFRTIEFNYEPGIALNQDFEIEAMVNGFAVESIKDVTSGTSVTLSGDIGLVAGVGGSLIYDGAGNLVGSGVTVGMTGIPDIDVSGNVSGPIDFLNDMVNSDSNRDKTKNSDRPTGRNRSDRVGGRAHREKGSRGHSIEH